MALIWGFVKDLGGEDPVVVAFYLGEVVTK